MLAHLKKVLYLVSLTKWGGVTLHFYYFVMVQVRMNEQYLTCIKNPFDQNLGFSPWNLHFTGEELCLALLEETICAPSSLSESGHINSGTIPINLLYGRVQKSILNGDTWLGGAGY